MVSQREYVRKRQQGRQHGISEHKQRKAEQDACASCSALFRPFRLRVRTLTHKLVHDKLCQMPQKILAKQNQMRYNLKTIYLHMILGGQKHILL